jgi:hypothetical protein
MQLSDSMVDQTRNILQLIPCRLVPLGIMWAANSFLNSCDPFIVVLRVKCKFRKKILVLFRELRSYSNDPLNSMENVVHLRSETSQLFSIQRESSSLKNCKMVTCGKSAS